MLYERHALILSGFIDDRKDLHFVLLSINCVHCNDENMKTMRCPVNSSFFHFTSAFYLLSTTG